jgi:hypothetical protein
MEEYTSAHASVVAVNLVLSGINQLSDRISIPHITVWYTFFESYTRRMKSYEDFIAVAEHLIATRYTTCLYNVEVHFNVLH